MVETNFQIIEITYWKEFIYLLVEDQKLIVGPYCASRSELAIEWHNQT